MYLGSWEIIVLPVAEHAHVIAMNKWRLWEAITAALGQTFLLLFAGVCFGTRGHGGALMLWLFVAGITLNLISLVLDNEGRPK